MHSRFVSYSMGIKSIAFIPSILCFIVFFTLIIVYGRMTQESPPSPPASNAPVFTSHEGEQSKGSPNNELQRSVDEKQK